MEFDNSIFVYVVVGSTDYLLDFEFDLDFYPSLPSFLLELRLLLSFVSFESVIKPTQSDLSTDLLISMWLYLLVESFLCGSSLLMPKTDSLTLAVEISIYSKS